MIPPSDSLIPLLGANPPQKMKNIISEPVLSLTTTIVLFLLSFTGSIFLVTLKLVLFSFNIHSVFFSGS